MTKTTEATEATEGSPFMEKSLYGEVSLWRNASGANFFMVIIYCNYDDDN